MTKFLGTASAAAFVVILSAGFAAAGGTGSAPSGANAPQIVSLSLNGLMEYRSSVRVSTGLKYLSPGNNFIPEAAATIGCKAGVSKCAIEAEVTAQLSPGSGIVSVCPIIDGTYAGNGCDETGALNAGAWTIFHTMKFSEMKPGTTHSITLEIDVITPKAPTVNTVSARYTSLYK